MRLVKCDGWPAVLPDDDGLRPTAGSPNNCFYCKQAVGQPHGPRCVCVYKMVRYRVFMNLDQPARSKNPGKLVGTFTREDPHFWDETNCNFHKNDGSWCADNALDQIVWTDSTDQALLENRLNATNDEHKCCCSELYFEYDETVDQGPFVMRPTPTEETPCSTTC